MMNEIKSIIDDLSIEALESSISLAAVAVISDSGALIYQTENWDLTNQTKTILNILQGVSSFVLNKGTFSVVETNKDGIISTNDDGMGHILFVPFQGGVLVSYAMPRVDLHIALTFLKNYAMKLKGKV